MIAQTGLSSILASRGERSSLGNEARLPSEHQATGVVPRYTTTPGTDFRAASFFIARLFPSPFAAMNSSIERRQCMHQQPREPPFAPNTASKSSQLAVDSSRTVSASITRSRVTIYTSVIGYYTAASTAPQARKRLGRSAGIDVTRAGLPTSLRHCVARASPTSAKKMRCALGGGRLAFGQCHIIESLTLIAHPCGTYGGWLVAHPDSWYTR